jgi:hypothetical protein
VLTQSDAKSVLAVHSLFERFCSGHGRRSAHRRAVGTAFHETGHAIVAHRLGVWVDSVTTDYETLIEVLGHERAPYYAGNCRFKPWVECANGDLRPLSRAESATIDAAGLAAEALASGKHPLASWSARASQLRDWAFWVGVDNDWSCAMRALGFDCREGRAALRAFRSTAARALTILSDERAVTAFELLVPRLLEGDTLYGYHLLEALGTNRVGDPNDPRIGASFKRPWWFSSPGSETVAA